MSSDLINNPTPNVDAVRVGERWNTLVKHGIGVDVIGFDTANGRVRVRKVGGKRDTFVRARTLRKRYKKVG